MFANAMLAKKSSPPQSGQLCASFDTTKGNTSLLNKAVIGYIDHFVPPRTISISHINHARNFATRLSAEQGHFLSAVHGQPTTAETAGLPNNKELAEILNFTDESFMWKAFEINPQLYPDGVTDDA